MRFWLEIIRLDGSPFFGFEIAGANLTVRNAKRLMKEHTEWRSQEMELLHGTHRLGNEELLMDLVEDFHLADMVRIPSYFSFRLELQMIRVGIMCSHCNELCSPERPSHCCGQANYCSANCQSTAWPDHRPLCNRRFHG